ncbi:MAG: hypothetical protein Nkreftii_001418 [Candidatus Nitrospira kreftii]|uniref:7-cyano-7-deazaguanine synthase n=1 Tax=Candidatus Nitrospira kreftii TaxID=2652173 RepID=A0A7S8IZ10_9BACT|nr:MAG: hypothetical protein Nkreftii_001418 [Candidatus Nitrospira kreftii]
MKKKLSDNPIKILWTGGWDSTFRVLYANLVDGQRIEPHYIVDTARQSSLRELQAISEIIDSLRISHKAAYERISNLRITLKSEIADDIAITNAWARLKLRSPLGSQYDWLARYAESQNMVDLELSVHVDDKAHFFLRGKVEHVQDGSYRLRRGITGDENIFARFRFPILEYSKAKMRETARKHGFIDLLEKSWFCHRPINGVPCGMCSPCIYTIKEGMRYRFPRESVLRYHLERYRLVIQSPSQCARVLRARLRTIW